jgi:hypothetical protein
VHDSTRQTRWLFAFRLMTLLAVVFVLPRVAPVAVADRPALLASLAGLLVLWALPLWGPWAREDRVLGMFALVEAIGIAVLVDGHGRLESPFALLFLPMLAQAAILLSPVGYALVATVAVVAYGVAVRPDLDPTYLPAWTPLFAAGLLLVVGWLGLLGAGLRRERLHGELAERRFRRFRSLVERLPSLGRHEDGWRRFLRQVEHAGGFTDGAIVYWEGPRARVIATERQASWETFVRRNGSVFRHRLIEAHEPEIFVEAREDGRSRSIVCWPLVADRDGEGASGALCMLADTVLSVREAERRLRHWAPLAALGLAAQPVTLSPQRAPIDWRVIMNATLHKLHDRLKRHLVLVNVEPGLVDADAALVADAIARILEDTLARVPDQSQIRLDVARVAEGWRFRVRTNAPAQTPDAGARRRLLEAQRAVAAHGGEWLASKDADGYEVGFVLPGGGRGLTSEGSGV